MSNVDRFCWCWSLRSIVTKESNPPETAARNKSPFRLLAQPISGVVLTSWANQLALQAVRQALVKQDAHGRGERLWLVRGRRSPVPWTPSEIVKELGQWLSGFEIVDEGLERHARPHENRRPAHHLWVAVYDGVVNFPHSLNTF